METVNVGGCVVCRSVCVCVCVCVRVCVGGRLQCAAEGNSRAATVYIQHIEGKVI